MWAESIIRFHLTDLTFDGDQIAKRIHTYLIGKGFYLGADGSAIWIHSQMVR